MRCAESPRAGRPAVLDENVLLHTSRRRLAISLIAHLETWRPYTIFYVGFVGLAGAMLTDTSAPAWRYALAWLAPTVGWVGAHYGGDFFDRELDLITKPHRPIPSGRLPVTHALGGLVVCAAAGAAMAVLVNWRSLVLVLLGLLGSLGYSRVFKARGISGNIVRGALAAFAVLFGAMCVASFPPLALLPVALVVLLHDVMSNLVGTLRDIDGDKAGDYQTFSVRRGVRISARLTVALAVTWIAITVLIGLLSAADGTDLTAYYCALAVAVVLTISALQIVVRSGDDISPAEALRAHSVLVIERVVLAGAFLVLATGPAIGLLVVPALLVTGWTQSRIRRRHEFGRREHIDLGPDIPA